MKWNDIPRERLSIIDNVGDISDQESLGYHSQIVYSCDSFFKYFDKYIQSRQSDGYLEIRDKWIKIITR